MACTSLAVAGGGALLLAALTWQLGLIRRVRELPAPESVDDWVGAEADIGTRIVTI